MRIVRVAVAIISLLPSLAYAEHGIDAIQAKAGDVFLRIGNKAVGKMVDPRCIIDKYQGDWAWVRTFDGKEGWVERGSVVPMQRAIEYFRSSDKTPVL